MITKWHTELVEYIKDDIQSIREQFGGAPEKMPDYYAYLTILSPEHLAFITIHTFLDASANKIDSQTESMTVLYGCVKVLFQLDTR